MKASEFVAQIQTLIAEHGDLEVRAYEYGCGTTGPASVGLHRPDHLPQAFYVEADSDG